MVADQFSAPQKHHVRIEKHFDGDTAHEPDEVLEFQEWNEADGKTVTDPARIAELEKIVAENADKE